MEGAYQVTQGDEGVDDCSPWAAACPRTFIDVYAAPRFVWVRPRTDSAPPTTGSPGHVRPLDSLDLLGLEQFSERLTRFHEDAAPRQQRAARVPCDTLSGNATGEWQASQDAATVTCPDRDARGGDTTPMANMSAFTSETTCPDDALTDADAAPSSRAPEAADDEVTRLDGGRASNNFVPSPSSPAPSGPHGKTMMLRNIPCSVTQEELEKVIHEMGFGDRCDFVYVPPSHRPKTNIGYAFVNLIDEASADAFKLDFDSFRFPGKLSKKFCEVQPARLQGRVAQLNQSRKAGRGCPSP
mmetsp:Transcript_29838/g.88618  ORF Transcript_29838/g.88618 Transcript_29838/m.88618 type:complete len:298 (+) Transcript_29838:112-1005(+)